MNPALTELQRFFERVSGLDLDDTELSLLTALLIMHSGEDSQLVDLTGLEEGAAIDQHQDNLLTAFRRHMRQQHADQPLRWPRILMLLREIRGLSTGHYNELMHKPLDDNADEVTSSLYPLLAYSPRDCDV
ncbi:hypothetical protein C0Q70_04378 [Pomacea canaliculata]|uniref:NR LBD domain-containing protein n=1 Tax=Pomacea canaliculata TaxID=400727 RepID=A0A2T7PVD4_POMCA|nr:hypothetical protein C0Q70_04378 [Pomacea canaliculata]